jgi:trigger factor
METLEKQLATKVKVLKEESCEVTLSIELSKEDVAEETESVFKSIQARAVLPGFRAGKAPIAMVKQNFADRARQTVLENLIARAATQVLKEKKIQSINTPKVEKIEFEIGKPLVFHMKIEKDPEVKAKDYKGIKVTRPDDKIKDEHVEKTIKEIQDRNATLVASTATEVGKSHFVTLDFEGKIDGKPFQGGTSTNYLLDMDQPQTIAGFSEGLMGAKVTEERDITVTFPKDYTRKEWAEKQAVFHVKIREIKEKKLPILDDEFAKDVGLTSLAELQQKVRENLQQDATAKADKEMEDQLFQALIDNHSFSVPATLVEERNRALTQRALYNLSKQGLVSAEDAQAQATLKEKTKPQAEKDVRLSYLLKAIATQEKLDATAADVEDLHKKALDDKDAKPAEIDKYFQERDLSIRASLTEGKVLDFLKKHAKIKTA